MKIGNDACYVCSQGVFAIKSLVDMVTGYQQQEVYLEATKLLIDFNNQLMEELDMIKRWCTLLQEDTENAVSREIK